MALLDEDERDILYPRWSCIEAGSTLSDEFRIMWEPKDVASKDRELVHRCLVDSDDPKDHGCVTRALDHAEGSVAFIRDFLNGALDGSFNEDEFLNDLGMFMGIASHHIADLCTPVHVGHKLDYKKVGAKSARRFHAKVERDIGRLARQVSLQIHPPKVVEFSRDLFWGIAREAYDSTFLELEAIYSDSDENALLEMASLAVTSAVRSTRDVWHTIFKDTQMTSRKWSSGSSS